MTAPSAEIIRQVRAEYGPRTLLAFSRGKDAIASWLALRDHFEEVVAYHLFLVPGLEFVEESLAYYERFFGCKIHNLPHPRLYEWFRAFTFQSPEHAAVIAGANLPKFTYLDIVEMLGAQVGVDNPMAASGVRAADSPMRRIQFATHGAISAGRRHYYPVFDWNMDRLVDEISRAGVKLPIDYDLFGRSFDGLDLRFLLPLKKHRPADYRRVIEWFPLASVEVWRYEKYGATHAVA